MNHIKQFDRQDTLVVITSYPVSDTAKGYSAIDRYSEHKIADIAKKRPVIVCAQKEPQAHECDTKNIAIKRTWKKGSVISLLNTYWFIIKQTNTRSVLVEFEFNVFGGILANIMMLAIMWLLTLQGKNVVIELHQVVTNINKLKKHLNVRSWVAEHFYSLSLKLYYIGVGLASSHIIVLEEALKKRLSVFVPSDKITVLPHHMDIHCPIANTHAKNILGIPKEDFTILVFGYINYYKGVDWIVRASRLWKNQNIRLIIAGGENPYHINKSYYKKYYRRLMKSIEAYDHITATGFVPEKDIQTYFSAADLVVLPYRVFMSASGPYSLALSYGKPAILSNKLKGYHESPDFRNAYASANITENDIFFHMEMMSLFEKIQLLKTSKNHLKKLRHFSKILAHKRSFAHTQDKLIRILFPLQTSVIRKSLNHWSTSFVKQFSKI